jgi:hypothetical protein
VASWPSRWPAVDVLARVFSSHGLGVLPPGNGNNLLVHDRESARSKRSQQKGGKQNRDERDTERAGARKLSRHSERGVDWCNQSSKSLAPRNSRCFGMLEILLAGCRAVTGAHSAAPPACFVRQPTCCSCTASHRLGEGAKVCQPRARWTWGRHSIDCGCIVWRADCDAGKGAKIGCNPSSPFLLPAAFSLLL